MNSQSKPKERRRERRRLTSVLSAVPAAALTAAVVCLTAAACSVGGGADLASVEVNTSPEDTREEGAQEAAPPQSPQPASPASPSSSSSSSADASSGGASQVRTTSSNPDPLPEPPSTPPPAPPSQPPSPSSGGGRAAATQASPQNVYLPLSVEWEALRQCESRGSYTFVDPTGTYHGAYQFTTRTWDRLAAGFDDDLVGVLPSAASATAQDKMAARLWIESRSSRWPACAHVFGEEAAEEYLASLLRSSQTPSAAAPATTSTTATPSSGASDDPPAASTTTTTPPAGSSSPAPPPSDGGGGTSGGGTDAPATAPDPSTLPAVIPNVDGFPTQEQWAALRHCEARNNYQIVSSNGLYYGAYQFWPDTWDSVARKYYPRLLGVLPSHATPQDQDRMAYKLWETRGSQPWPVCGRHLN